MTSVLADFYDGGFHHHGPGAFGWLLFVVLLGALIFGAVALATRLFGSRSHVTPSQATPVLPARDSALEALRLRYARGEVSREEFLRVSADLGHPGPSEEGPDEEQAT